MTRLANIEKAGYYPLPPAVTDQIASYIEAPRHGRILDPCAGEGEALVTLAAALNLTPYGVELHEERARTARAAIDAFLAEQERPSPTPTLTHIFHDSYLNLIAPHNSFNLLYINPPYDHDDEDSRLEYQWLTRSRPWLQPGGLLIWVVPQHLLKLRKAVRYLAGWYEQLTVYRFPDLPQPGGGGSLYEQFHQIVLFGRRRVKGVPPDEETVARLIEMAAGKDALPPLAAAASPAYRLPALIVPDGRFHFRSFFIDPADALAEAANVGVTTGSDWQQHLDPAGQQAALQPLTPLKLGHMHSVIAAGHLNNQVLAGEPDLCRALPRHGDEPGQRLLIKGRSYKVPRHDQYREELPDGRIRVTNLETETVVTDITTINSEGLIQDYKGPALEQFLKEWITHLTGIVARTYTPVYQFDLNGYGGLLNRLSKKRPIPGLNGKSGLLPAQKHAAAAVLTRLERAREAIIVGEMGTGKAQPLDCKVLTLTGWKRMGDIKEGDEVVDPEGGTARVVGVYPQGMKDIYRVTFSDGSQTECCNEHVWQVLTPERKWRNHSPQLFELREIKNKLFSQSTNARYFIPLVKPIEFEEKPLPLDPYLLGALIGDGGLSSGNPKLTSADDEIIQEAAAALPDGVSFKVQGKYDYRISSKYRTDSKRTGSKRRCLNSNPVTSALRKLGLMGHRSETKFIPKRYLFSSVNSRIALLQGLLDTDGTIGGQPDGFTGHITYSTVSEKLARDITELVQSLGGTAKLTTRIPRYTHNGEKRYGQLAYQLNIKLPECIQPFRLTRKLERVRPRTKYGVTRAMVKIEYVGKKEAQCIALDSENQLYVTDDYIVTHNTTIGAAVAAGRHARRTIVLCPPHLVDKWQREFKAVWPAVRTSHLQTVADVDQFFGPQPDDKPLVGVLKQTSARSASGWVHAYDYGGPASHNYGSKGFSDVERLWGSVLQASDLQELSTDERVTVCRRRLTPRQIAAMQVRGIRCPVCGETVMMSGRPILFGEMKTATRHCTNAACGSPLYQFSRRRSESQERGSFKQYAQRERAIRAALASGRSASFNLTSPPPRADQGYAKVPLAGYIKKRGKGKLDLLLIDEVHQYKGIDSDQGYAMHHLAQAARKVVALTGTIYGGKASSLFYLLFRLAPEMAHQYVNPDASGQRRLRSREWVSAYGILQQIETITLDEDGRQTANSRSNIRYKELPGGSPAMLPWLLNRSVFLSLGDMGFPLPEYSEIPVSVPMHPVQADYYESLKQQLQAELKERLVRGDKSLLAGYLFALLFWPDSPRRAKVVRCPRTERVVASVPALPEGFIGPKEEEIIDLCLQEKAQGRRVLLLCQQTDTLDIQPEWKRMLEEAGLQAAILRAVPNKREGWVEKQVKAGVDVIISHPRKVETGIDLLDFPTIVWMAIDYSVYTVLQASRRSWRIGQTVPVKVYYFAYEETIQEAALRLVAAKVAATLRINGDTVGDDSLADLDDLSSGDLVTTLARIVVGEVEAETHSLQQAFAEANADLRQANVLIGDYTIVDEDEGLDEVASAANGRLTQPLVLPANSTGNGHTGDHARQGSLLNQAKGNGRNDSSQVDHPDQHANGQGAAHRDAQQAGGNGRRHTANGDLNGRSARPAAPTTPAEPDDQEGQPPPAPSPPPVPRPRLVF